MVAHERDKGRAGEERGITGEHDNRAGVKVDSSNVELVERDPNRVPGTALLLLNDRDSPGGDFVHVLDDEISAVADHHH